MLVAYATEEGELASDVGADAGPYAKVLADEIVKPGVEAVVMFRAMQRRVRAAIHQEPCVAFSALGDVYFAGKVDPTTPIPQPALSRAEREWQQYGKDTKDIGLLEAFKEKYKADPVYVRLVEARIEQLKKQRIAVVPHPKPSESAPPSRSAAEALNEASRSMGRGDYTQAIADYNDAIRLNPKLAIAFRGRGASY